MHLGSTERQGDGATKLHRLNDALNTPKRLRSLIILNGPPLDRNLLGLVWPKLQHEREIPVICADGGANLLYDATSSNKLRQDEPIAGDEFEWIPTHIVGDLDSLRPDVRQFYEKQGVKIVERPSVNSNDFQKALQIENSLAVDEQFPSIVIGGHGGRMDQTLGNLNILYSCAEAGHDLYWLDTSNMVYVLGAGKHHISVDPSREGPICGLIPIGRPVSSITTEGLKWNLNSQKLAFGTGGLVSTSNEVIEPVAVIETSDPVLWTIVLHL